MRGFNINDPYTTSILDNDGYAEPSPGNPRGGLAAGPASYLEGPDLGNGPTNGNDVIIGTIGQLKGLNLNGLGGYNIFQLSDTPGTVTDSVPYPWFDFTYYTVDSVGLLDSLRNFQEIDFTAKDYSPSQYGVPGGYWPGYFTQIDASKLNIKTLGVYSQPWSPGEWYSFGAWTLANLSSNNLVIAKVDPAAGLGDQNVALQALRTSPSVLNPSSYEGTLSGAHGAFAQGGVVKLQVNSSDSAFNNIYVMANAVGKTGDQNHFSDYQSLTLTGNGIVLVFNAMSGGDALPLAQRNDNSKIDASAFTGFFSVVNDPLVKENFAFPRSRDAEAGVHLTGSTLGKMDIVTNAGMAHSGIYFYGSNFSYGGVDQAPDANNGAEQLVAKGTTLANQFLLAEKQSIADSHIVWFVGVDHNTYILDAISNAPIVDATPLTLASGRHAASAANPNDYVIELVGVHTVDTWGAIDGAFRSDS